MSTNDLAGFLPFVLIALVFWFLIVRPQRRRQQALTSTQNSLGTGAEVMLSSGIFGTVVSVEDDAVHLQIAAGTTVKVAKQAIVKVLTPAVTGPEDADDYPAASDPTDPPGPADPSTGQHH